MMKKSVKNIWREKIGIDSNYTSTGVTFSTENITTKPADYNVKYTGAKTIGDDLEKEFENYAECKGCGQLAEKEELDENGYCDVQCKYNSCIIADLDEESEE